MTTIESGQLSFSVEGAFIMDLARDRYWFEEAQEHGLKILGTLQGMTVDQAFNVLNGDAILSGIDGPNSTIEYREVEDKEFKAKLAARKKWLAQKVAEEDERRQKERERLERREQLEEERRERHDFWMQPLPKIPETDLDKSVEKVSLGKFTVPADVLKRYIQVYVTHHFTGAQDPYRLVMENNILMQIHERLRKSVGLKGMWGRTAGNEPDEFDAALQEVCWDAIKKDERYGKQRLLERAGIKSTEKTYGGDEPPND